MPEKQVKIIAGQWKGRKIKFSDRPGLRPTPGRLRETLFNWLAPCVQGARCLDLFSGSGALSWEALSRGAAEATLLETDRRTVQNLMQVLFACRTDLRRPIRSLLTWDDKAFHTQPNMVVWGCRVWWGLRQQKS